MNCSYCGGIASSELKFDYTHVDEFGGNYPKSLSVMVCSECKSLGSEL